MATIKVDPELLRSIGRQVRRIHDAFHQLDEHTARYASVAVAGDARVAAQLREFSSNWYLRRAEMAERMEDLAGHLDGAAAAYAGTDGAAAKGFQRGRGGS